MKITLVVSILFLFIGSFQTHAQKYSEGALRDVLNKLATDHPGLNNQLQLNVSGLPLTELVNSVALENNLNVFIDPNLNQIISYNFYNAQVKDMLVFLYLNFDLEFDFVGSIISIKKRAKAEVRPSVVAPEKMNLNYNPSNKFLSMDLKNDTLFDHDGGKIFVGQILTLGNDATGSGKYRSIIQVLIEPSTLLQIYRKMTFGHIFN